MLCAIYWRNDIPEISTGVVVILNWRNDYVKSSGIASLTGGTTTSNHRVSHHFAMGGRNRRKQPEKEVPIEIPPGVDKQHVDRYASFFDEKPGTVMEYSPFFLEAILGTYDGYS